MRDIKFRAFIKNIGWVVPVEQINFDVRTIEVDLSSGQGDTSEFDFDEIELMQFTGLKDKNEVEIYEGDTVIDTEYKTVKEVVWRDNGFKLKYTYQRRYMGEKYTETNYLELRETDSRRWGLEVIGNVYKSLEGEE